MTQTTGNDSEPLDHTELLAYNKWRQDQGLPLEPEKLEKRPRAMNLSDKAMAHLDEIAVSHGLMWGRRGNVSELIEAIGQGLLKVEAL